MTADGFQRTFLVTGASGFIGRHAAQALAARGHRVIALSRDPEAARRGIGESRIDWRPCDLLDPGDAERRLAQIEADTLVHLAWDVAPGYWHSDANLKWLEASLRLLRAFLAGGGSRVVSAGTCAEYDWADPQIAEKPIVERSAQFAPQTLYAACKGAFHMALDRHARASGFAAAWGLVFFPYGPGERPERLVPQVARALLRGERPETTEGTQLRDFIDVRDAGAAFAALADSRVEGPVNIASGQAISVREVVERIRARVAPKAEIAFGALPQRPDDPARLVADISRLTGEVGFTPKFTLEEGLRDAVAWWRSREAP